MTTINRRYDIDWLRVIAIALLLIYHLAIGFQPWGVMIGFITNREPWPSLWLPMSMLNIWRIPFLFFVSGMGVYFAMQQRNWMQLLQERATRILIPYVFGMFCIFPVSVAIWQWYNGLDVTYSYNPGHLWFLGNIFVYVVVLSPLLFYLKKNADGKFAQGLKKIMSTPFGVLPVISLFIAELLILRPVPYELYAMTWHGFVLGFLAFFSGFCLVLSGEGFLKMILKYRWVFLLGAIALFAMRIGTVIKPTPGFLLVIESDCWIFTMFAFGYRYLNHPGKALTYLSEAAYPVYILHMIFLFLGSALIFPLAIPVQLKFILVLAFTFAGCFGTYEVVKRIEILRLFFGLKVRWKAMDLSKSARCSHSLKSLLRRIQSANLLM